MRRISLFLMAISFSTGACGKKTAEPPTTAPPTATVAPTAPAEPDAAGAADTVENTAAPVAADAVENTAAPVAEDAAAPAEDTAAPAPDPKLAALENQARVLLSAWVTAQNNADLAVYSALYAPRFTGIKRSGTRLRTFAHDSWLTDRGRMFKNAMVVSADDVEVALAGDTAVVSFTQTWASGTYQDKGPKQLVLVPTKAGLKIAREEMLASEMQAGGAEAKPVEVSRFMLGIQAGTDSYVVIPAEVDSTWSKGAPKLVQKNDPTIIVQGVDPEKLPPELKAWIGKKVVAGSCNAAIDRLDLVGRFVPHFGVVQMWNGTDGVDEVGKAMSDDEIALDAWGSSGLEVVLAGHVPGCDGILWAHGDEHEETTNFIPAEIDAGFDRAAVAELRKLSGWKTIQKEAKASEPPVTTETWDVWQDAMPSVHLFTDEKSGRAFVQVTASAGNGCGEFGASFGAIFEVKNMGTKPTFVLLTDAEGGPTREVVDVIDLDGDGEVEFVPSEGLIQRVGPIWNMTLDASPPNYDCPC